MAVVSADQGSRGDRSEPTTISQEATISTAAEIMLEKKFSGLPVVDDVGKLVGIITESDIFRLVVREWGRT